MAKLTISGSGKWINVNPLDEMTAKKYAETVVLLVQNIVPAK